MRTGLEYKTGHVKGRGSSEEGREHENSQEG
jgi:hypothetical protein